MVDSIRTRISRGYNRFMQRNANFWFRSILHTSPAISSPDAETILYCALGRSACRQYIAMVKSFLRYTTNVVVVAQDDGSLEEEQIAELREHIKGIKILRLEDMFRCVRDVAGDDLLALLPGEKEFNLHTSVKIMYLKFLNVIFRFNGRKVIIVDSDLLFLKKPNEIINWIEKPYSQDFYGEGSNAKAEEFYKMGFAFEFLDIADFSSGTIGIGGIVPRQQLIDIFQRITDYDPTLFYAWEIEQALWSVVMSGRENPLNLDSLSDIYIGSGWRPYTELRDQAVIAHFAGAVRFNYFRYLRCLHDVVWELNRAN